MTIPALPDIKVYIAFNPSNLTAPKASQTWTQVQTYLRDYDVTGGRQHYLDRVQASSLRMTVNNRTGFFLNGTTNGTGYVIQPRCLVWITATWSGTTYDVFYGLIDSIQESVQDQVNADLVITASDFLKYFSLKYLSNPQFYPSYAQKSTTQNYYRLGGNSPFVVTEASGSGTVVTFKAQNSFLPGQIVSVYNLVDSSGNDSALNLQNATIASATATQFTVSDTTTGSVYNQNGVAYVTRLFDENGTVNYAQYLTPTNDATGQVAFPSSGAMVYDPQNCSDLSNGSSTPSGCISLNSNIGSSGTSYGLDFWVLGASLFSTKSSGTSSGITILASNQASSGSVVTQLCVDSQGYIYLDVNGTKYYHTTKIQVSDGYWHHVGYYISGGVITLYTDNQTKSTGVSLASFTAGHALGTIIGASSTLPAAVGLFQDAVIAGTATGLLGDIQNRFRAGQLLQRGQPVTSEAVYSGDRIAEALVITGFGSISGGTLSGLSSVYSINGSPYSTPYSSNNGFINVEPYYWDSPVTGSSVLDVIQAQTDTDIGAFYQKNDGTFEFFNQRSYGSWSWQDTTSTDTLLIGNGSKSLTVDTGWTVPANTPVLIYASAGAWMSGVVTSYNSSTGALVANVTANAGTGGLVSGWTVTLYQSYKWLPITYAPSADLIWTDDNSSNVSYEPSSLQVLRDDADLWTTVKVTPQSGTEQTYDSGNEARWGYSTLTKSGTLHPSLSLALSTATFLGYLYRSPLPRVNNVEIRSTSHNGGTLPAILGTDFGDIVLFKRSAPNSSTSGSYPDVKGQISVNMVVESINHSFMSQPGIYTATYVLDPYPVRS